MARQVPWIRIFAEGVAIVASILLAFGIQAWWDGQRDRAEEREILMGLRRELSDIRAIIDEDLVESEAAELNLRSFLAMSPVETSRIPPDSSYFTVLLPIVRPWTQPRPAGFLNATVSSGKLALVRDASLRAALSELGADGEYVDQTSDDLQELSRDGATVMGRHPELAVLMGTGQQGGSPIPGHVLAAVRADADLTGIAGAKLHNWSVYQILLRSLGNQIDLVATMIDQQLGVSTQN